MVDMRLDDLNFAIQVAQNEADRLSRLIDQTIARGMDPAALNEKYQRKLDQLEELCAQRRSA